MPSLGSLSKRHSPSLVARLVRGAIAPLAIAALAQACVAEHAQPKLRRGTPKGAAAGQESDTCAPGQAPAANDDPTATCALTRQYHVPDLTEPTAMPTSAGGVGTKTLHPLDAMNGAQAAPPKSCATPGPGISTCGPDGNDDCCRVAPVPGGKAGAIEVEPFGLDVYEVTSGRFAAFVAQTGGNLRQAASTGGWPGWDPSFTDKLPASREEIDIALGPACQARSDVRNYGALTWPSADTEAAVAEIINHDNAQAADIRADATPARLHQKPINCVTYWIAAAFCAWDGGGRLPSADEWTFAAVGGDELREYAWPNGGLSHEKLVTELNHNPDDQRFTFPEGFPFGGNGQNAYHIAPPGRKPAGVARWGHHDMSGNLVEWTSANVNNTHGVVRGGSWEGHEEKNSFAHVNYPLDRSYGSLGIRCARGPAPAAKPAVTTPAGGVVIHRAHDAARGDHLLGTTAGEGAPAFAPQGIAFRISATEQAGASSPLHRCLTADGDHFLSNDPNCEGHTDEGRLGWTAKAQTPGTIALYRCLAPNGKGHLSTVTPAECTAAGYTVEGTQGFVHGPPPSAFIVSLYERALGRSPDASGHVSWLTSILGKGCSAPTLATVIESFYLSPEFLGRQLDDAQKVDALYRGALGRAPEPEAAANVPAMLANGTPWKSVVEGVARSAEAAGLAPGRCQP